MCTNLSNEYHPLVSWESTVTYYSAINQGIKEKLGGLHSAKIALYSVDFAEIEQMQVKGEWDKAGEVLTNAAQSVEAAGADCVLICTNTMHKVADQIERAIHIPLLHIADATAATLKQQGINRIGLLGTRFTMEQDFYKSRLTEHYGIDVIIPEENEREIVHKVIYEELCLGQLNSSSKSAYLQIIESLYQQGAQGVILGCTEIGLLVQQQDTKVPLFDTTRLHVDAAVEYALGS